MRIIFECADATEPDIRADRNSLAIARQQPGTQLRVVVKPAFHGRVRVSARRVGTRARAVYRTDGADEEKRAAFVFLTRVPFRAAFPAQTTARLEQTQRKGALGERERKVELEALISLASAH